MAPWLDGSGRAPPSTCPTAGAGRCGARTRIRLRLRGLTWRLVDIEMADMLRDQIAAKLGRALARAKIGAGGGEER